MNYKVFNATVSWYNSEKQKQQNLRGTGSDEVGLYNWCIDQLETLSQFDNYKHLRFMITEEDEYDTGDFEDETEKAETERTTEEKTES